MPLSKDTVREFLNAFEEVFHQDWAYTKQKLDIHGQTEEQKKACAEAGLEEIAIIADDGTFVNPKVEDEMEDWGNRARLLTAYRALKKETEGTSRGSKEREALGVFHCQSGDEVLSFFLFFLSFLQGQKKGVFIFSRAAAAAAAPDPASSSPASSSLRVAATAATARALPSSSSSVPPPAVVSAFVVRGRLPRRLRCLKRRVRREKSADALLRREVLEAAVGAHEVEAGGPLSGVRPHDDGADRGRGGGSGARRGAPQLPLRLGVPRLEQLDHVVKFVLVQLLALRDGVDQGIEVLGRGGARVKGLVADLDGGIDRRGGRRLGRIADGG